MYHWLIYNPGAERRPCISERRIVRRVEGGSHAGKSIHEGLAGRQLGRGAPRAPTYHHATTVEVVFTLYYTPQSDVGPTPPSFSIFYIGYSGTMLKIYNGFIVTCKVKVQN